MRARALPILGLPLLLTYCGAKNDLLLGEVALVSESGKSGSAGSSTGAEPSSGGSLASGNGGAGGSTAATTGEGGLVDVVGAAGAGGEPSGETCINGERPPLGSLIHRYGFDGVDATVFDSINGANGEIKGGLVLDGSGMLTLDGNDGEYVDLPNGLVHDLTDLTIVTWVTWTGGAGYQRIFDFGISDKGEVIGGSGRTYFTVIPLTGFEDNTARGLGAEIKLPGMPSLQIASHQDMKDLPAQVGFVFQGGQRVALYLDGNLLGEAPTTITLDQFDDRNNWLGQSQWEKDPPFQGSFSEFRIYDVALTGCQLKTLLFDGQDTILSN